MTSNASSDLQYVLQESDVSLRNQYEICQHYKNLKVFGAMADDKAELRQALKDDFRIDHIPPMLQHVLKSLGSSQLGKWLGNLLARSKS